MNNQTAIVYRAGELLGAKGLLALLLSCIAAIPLLGVGLPSMVNLTSSTGGPVPYVFETGVNGHLFVNYWSTSNMQFTWVDLGLPPGAKGVYAPKAILYGSGNIFVFGVSDNGHLVVNYCPYCPGATAWWADLGLPPGNSTVYSPAPLVYGTQINVFAIAGNGHLVAAVWNGSGAWRWVDQKLPQGVTSVSGLSPIASQPVSTIGNRGINVFAVGSNGHLFVNYCPSGFVDCTPGSSNWNWHDQGLLSGASRIASPSAVTFGGRGLYVFVSASNGHLAVNYCGSGDCTPGSANWSWADQGLPPGAASVNYPSAIAPVGQRWTNASYDGNGGIFVFCSANDGRLVLNQWNGAGWYWRDLGRPPQGLDVFWWPQANPPDNLGFFWVAGVANNSHLVLYSAAITDDQGYPPIDDTYWDLGSR